MRKYYFKDAAGQQQGPLSLEELKKQLLTPTTPVWYDSLPEWITAGDIEELKLLLAEAVAPVIEIASPPATPAANGAAMVSATAATTAAASPVATKPAPAKKEKAPKKKGPAWVSWVLSLLVIGGAGYFVYQGMEKDKAGSSNVIAANTADTTSHNAASTTDESVEPTTNSSPDTTAVTTTATEPVANTSPTTTTTPATTGTKTPKTTAATTKLTTPANTKTPAQKKAEEDRKKKETADAQAARELQVRNNWPNYITFGKLNYEAGDGIPAFDVPVYNASDALIDQVTVRVDYLKKEGKVVKSETITINNIPPRSGVNSKAPENKKGRKVNVYITGVRSKKLHFCYPQNNGNATDPYYCN